MKQKQLSILAASLIAAFASNVAGQWRPSTGRDRSSRLALEEHLRLTALKNTYYSKIKRKGAK